MPGARSRSRAGRRPHPRAPGQDVLGGHSGHFADPDHHIWEVAHDPYFPLDEAGIVTLPE